MSDIGVKLGVEGESEFKNALKGINTNLKTLGTEMKAVTSAFDRNDTSIENLSEQNKVLNKQIDEQKTKLEMLKTRLAESAKEYGENDAKTQKWQQAVNLATADLNKSELQLKNNTAVLENAGDESEDAGKKAKQSGDDAEKGGGGWSKLGGVLKGVAVGMAAVMAAAGAAAVALGKEVISVYADYEQLVGGVDTLFGDSSAAVQEYASSAFKTAGLSANEYMETVTSFSASLIQSLGGDTEKAAKYADMAITDMSDNANKMGTDMASIQNAYQGFAKQNYTMLDNLKLGYGGTKAEMERLLVDAGKIAGVEFDISSYADVTEAIHVMQESMGIAGTTATEAEETISGSISSMGAAWQNLLVGFGNSDADMGALTKSLVDAFQNVVKNITPVIENLVQALPVALEALLPAISSMLPMLLEVATGLLTQVIDAIAASLPALIPVAVDALLMIVGALIDNLPLIIDGATQLILALALGLAESLPELIPAAIDAVLTIVDTLIDNIDLLIDAAIEIIMALADGLIKSLPKLIKKAPEIIAKLVSAIIENAPKLLAAAVELITSLSTGLEENFRNILNKVGGWVKENIIQPIKDKVSDFITAGGDLIRGVWQGISDKATWLWNKVSGFFTSLTDRIKNFFGIASPSKLFADEIGGNLAAGVGVGFAKQMKTVAKQMNDSIPTSFDLGGISGGFSAGKVSSNVSQTVNIYSPTPLSPSQIARESKNAMRRLAWA